MTNDPSTAEEPSAAKDERVDFVDFVVAGAAHESRNALQRIRARVDVMRLSLKSQPELLDDLDAIENATRGLQRLFDELREFRAPICPAYERCDLRELMHRVWRHLDGHPAYPQATLSLPAEEIACDVDIFRIEQVFRNLFDNALSAGSAFPRIDVSWSTEPWNGNQAVKILVRDNGPGFTEQQRRKAFEPFFTTKCSGTGLGLAISRRIIESHLGHIAVVPEFTDGAAILIHLPLKQATSLTTSAETDVVASPELSTA